MEFASNEVGTIEIASDEVDTIRFISDEVNPMEFASDEIDSSFATTNNEHTLLHTPQVIPDGGNGFDLWYSNALSALHMTQPSLGQDYNNVDSNMNLQADFLSDAMGQEYDNPNNALFLHDWTLSKPSYMIVLMSILRLLR